VCSTGLNSHLYKRGFPVRHTIAVKNSFCYHSPVTNHLKAEAAVPSGEITRLLQRWQAGDATAFNELLPMIRSALRRIARHHLGRERRDHTMQPSSLVQEAFVRLIGQSNIEWQNRVHFFAVASHAMRHILVDYARKRLTLKRGKAIVQVGLPSGTPSKDQEEFRKQLKKFEGALGDFSKHAHDGTDAQLEASFSAVHDSFEMLAEMLPRK